MKAPDARDARIAAAGLNDFRGLRAVVVHRPELVDAERLVVEPFARLAEEDRARRIEADRERDQRHRNCEHDERDGGENPVLGRLDPRVQPRDRAFEQRHDRQVAEQDDRSAGEDEAREVGGEADAHGRQR